MADDTVLSVEIVDARVDGHTDVVVRCLRGTLRVGQEVRIVDTEGVPVSGLDPSAVLKIWRYGKAVDLIDPPHGGKLELVGEIATIKAGNLIIGF